MDLCSHKPVRRHAESGVLILAVTFLVLMMAGLSMSLLTEVRGEAQAVTHHETSLTALQMAETGLAQAELEILALKDAGTDGIGTVSGSLHNGTYQVTAVPSPLSPDRWVLTAQGDRELSRRRVEIGVRRREATGYMEGLFAKDGLSVPGKTRTDSYDSRLGTYAAQAVGWDVGGPFARKKGHIGSNQDVVLNGTDVVVRGNAIPGIGSTLFQNGTPVITGDTQARTEEVPIPDPSLAEFQNAYANNDNDSVWKPVGGAGGPKKGVGTYSASKMSLRLSGGDALVLPAGTYFFSSLSVSGSATITVTGKVKIYVTGSVALGGNGLINGTDTPSNFELIAHPYNIVPTAGPDPSPTISINGGSTFSGAVYAPAVDVNLKGGVHYYGAMVGKEMSVGGNLNFHYDEALRTIGGRGTVLLERLYWRELDPPRR